MRTQKDNNQESQKYFSRVTALISPLDSVLISAGHLLAF